MPTTKTTKPKKSTPAVFEIEQEEPAFESTTEDAEEFITFKRSHFYSVLVVLAFAVGLLLGFVIWGRDAAVPTVVVEEGQPSAAAQQPSGPVAEVPVTPEPQYVRYDIPTEGYPSLGPEDAPITIVEFSDFQCPFCSRFHQETFQSLMDSYPGQIRFVYRNLPLSFHINAYPAAEAALCAGDQNAYWEMHDVLFDNQSTINNAENALVEQVTYNQYATELGLDVKTFEECMTTRKFEQFIADDINFALKLRIESTPTFFINGLGIVGAQPLSSFTQIIDLELAGEIP